MNSYPKHKIIDDVGRMDFARVTEMLKDAYWSKGIGIEEVKQGAYNSALVFGAFTPDKLQIGYSRMISDKTRFAYLLDVYVDENFRGQGIGRAMIDFVLRHPILKDVYQWVLITMDAHGLCNNFGFKSLEFPERRMEIRTPCVRR
jgi:ribosomal protein S18 acetylase RimI-like enzyme